LRDPEPLPACDLLISESTYGGKLHEPVESLAGSLQAVIQRTVERGGKVIIPAFSLGRTQAVILYLQGLFAAKRLPHLPLFVDSPLAANATEVFHMHPECFDDETLRVLNGALDLFGPPRVQYTRSVEESKKLNARKEPCIVIAASGMCESGRILHHLKNNI